MRSIGLLLGLGLGASACTSDTTPTIYVDLSYQVRCLDCEPRSPDDPIHRIKAVDGEIGLSLDCRVRNVDGTRRVEWNAEHPSANSDENYTLSITNANIDGEESGGPCQVNVVEGSNRYNGSCGSDDPSSDQPCKINISEEGGIVKGDVFCDNVANVASLSVTRYLVAPGTRSDPMTFQVYGCAGLGL